MSTRSMFFAAGAAAASVSFGGSASALTPLSIDPSGVEPFESPSAHAQSAPSAFEPFNETNFEPAPELNRRGPRLQCVPFVRNETRVEIYGNANTWWQQARGRYARERDPDEGAVMVMRGYRGANRGHVAVVREMVTDRMMLVDHANWLNGGEITRSVPVRDVSPRGDWSQVQVWHVPGAHWGARTYNVQGFIIGDEPVTAATEADAAVAEATTRELTPAEAAKLAMFATAPAAQPPVTLAAIG